MKTLQVLGGLSLHGPQGPESERLPQRRPLAVLAVLAVARELGCSRPKLIGMLWADEEEAHTRHHLSDALTSIRHALGPCAIRTEGEMLYLNPVELQSDVAAFEDALAEGRLEDAVALYGGPLLDGFYVPSAGELDAFVGRARDRLAGQYAGALERLAHSAAASGHHRSAAEWLRRLVAHDPYNTRVVLKLLAELEGAGDRPNALRTAEAHDRRLRAELGVEPDAAFLESWQHLRAPVSPPTNGAALRPLLRVSPPQQAPPEAPAPPVPARRGWLAHPRRIAAASGGVTLLLILLVVVLRGRAPGGAAGADHWAVMPFTIVGTDTALLRLAGEMPGLIAMAMPGPPGPHVHDIAGVRRIWMSAGGSAVNELPEAKVLDIARRAGCGRALLSYVALTGGRVRVVLRLLAVPSGASRGFESGATTPDSAGVLLETLVNSLIAQDSALSQPPPDPTALRPAKRMLVFAGR